MKVENTSSHGSFKVWGSGFRFDYEALTQMLNITPLDSKRPVAYLKFDQDLAKAPLEYVRSFDKTNQIKALMYSNNTTTNLADTMDHDRVASLVEITARISRGAFDLQTRNFTRFSSFLCGDFDLKAFKVKKFKGHAKESEFYLARIHTHNNNTVSARACTLTGLMAALSDRTMRDLITMEFGNNHHNSAHSLLNVSSKLAIIGHVLDQNFIPQHKLEQYEAIQNQMDSTLIKRHKEH